MLTGITRPVSIGSAFLNTDSDLKIDLYQLRNDERYLPMPIDEFPQSIAIDMFGSSHDGNALETTALALAQPKVLMLVVDKYSTTVLAP